jgi:hypothetical protein
MLGSLRTSSGRHRKWWIAGIVYCFAVALTTGAPAAAQAACENEAVRSKQDSTYLPECRGWELVSPGSVPSTEPFGRRAAAGGGAYAYSSKYPTSNAQGSGFYYLARRGETGWSVEEVAPQDSPQVSDRVTCYQGLYYSTSLSQGVLSDGWEMHEENPTLARCGNESEELLVSNAPVGFGNLFLRSETGTYSLINTTPEGVPAANALLQYASASLSNIVFREAAALLPGAPAKEYDLYEWAGGALHLVSVLPGGAPAGGAELADGPEPGGARASASLSTAAHAVSEDGERVFFYAAGGLYVRLHALRPQSAISAEKCVEPGRACTVQVDAAQGGSGASGGGSFWYANASGSKVFFADESRLTASSFAIKGRPDLYEYNLETGALADLTPGRKVEPGDARGLSGASEDGSYLYFVADSLLTGSQENTSGAVAQPEAPNLYLYHEGALTFLATLNQARDEQVWQELNGTTDTNIVRARVSPNGLLLEFESANALTPTVNNAPAEEGDCGEGGAPCSEVYLYEAGSRLINCVSCGAKAPTGNSQVPGTASSSNSGRTPGYLTRTVFDSGQVFFTTPNALVENDTNQADDVYEYREGRVSLISSGLSPSGAQFTEASENGEEAFFVTGRSLVVSDTDSALSVYVARVNGGFEEPSAFGAVAEACESVEGCRPLSREPPVEAFGASAVFNGSGNRVAVEPATKEPALRKPHGNRKHGLTPRQRLKRALRRCARKRGRRRAQCRHAARSRLRGSTRGKRQPLKRAGWDGGGKHGKHNRYAKRRRG